LPLKATCVLHEIGICGREVFVRSFTRTVIDKPRIGARLTRTKEGEDRQFSWKRKQKAPRKFTESGRSTSTFC
jgi:hypothetical protein